MSTIVAHLPPDACAALDEVSRPEPGFPHDFLASPFIRHGFTAGATIQPRTA